MSKPTDFDFYCEVALKPDAEIDKVFENEKVLAFHHTKPAYEKHIVIIPKEHVWDIRAVENIDIFKDIMVVAQNILKDLDQEYIDQKGSRLISNSGKFQDTPHLHFHLIFGDRI